MPPTDLLTANVRSRLGALRRAIRARLFSEGTAWLLLGVVALVFVSLGFDYFFRMERPLRATVMVAALAMLGWILWRQIVRPLCVSMDVTAMALLVENRFNQLGDRLITAVQFSDRSPEDWEGISRSMIGRVADEANAMAGSLSFRQVVERRAMRRLGLAALSALAVLSLFTAWQLPVMSLWFRRNVALAQVDWPQQTYLSVLGGPDFRVVRGEDLRIVVEANGVVPSQIALHAEYASGEKMEVSIEAAAGGRRFARTFQAVAEEFDFYVTGGDDQLDRRRKHHVAVVDPPSLREVMFTVEHRGHMRRPPDRFDGSSGVIPVTPGSWIRIEGTANKDLLSGQAVLEGSAAIDLARPAGGDGQEPFRRVRGNLYMPTTNIPGSKVLKIVLVGEDGSTSRRGQQFVVQIQPDLVPSVELQKRVVGPVVTPMAAIPLRLAVKDDCGITDARVVIGCKDRQPIHLVVPDLPAAAEFSLDSEADLLPHEFKPGDVVSLFVEVQDNMPADFIGPPSEQHPQGAPGPNIGRSGQLDFRVVRPEDLMEELVRRQKELRIEFTEAITVHETSRGKTVQASQEAGADGALEAVRLLAGDASKLEVAVGIECAKAAEVLAAILAEMKANRVNEPADYEQMTDRLIDPLRALAGPLQEVVAGLVEAAALSDKADMATRLELIAEKQLAIRALMDEIHKNMHEITTKQEAEKEVLRLLRVSEELLRKIREVEAGRHERIFDPASQPRQPDQE